MSSFSNKINNQITAKEVRVLDDAEQNLGVLRIEDALRLAKEKGLDLVEISPAANPPVCKVISYDKFRYQQEKKLKKQRSTQKSSEQKQVQISVREARHDLETKARRADKFLGEGHRVEILMTLRGREKANPQFAKQKLEEFPALITVEHVILSRGHGGRGGFTIIVGPKR